MKLLIRVSVLLFIVACRGENKHQFKTDAEKVFYTYFEEWDAQSLYAQYGFENLAKPQNFMAKKKDNFYKKKI